MKKTSMQYFYWCARGILSTQCSFSFLADSWAVSLFWKGVSYCHKVLPLRCYKGPKTCQVCDNVNCICRQSYSSVWQKITTGHYEFNVWQLYLFFKIWYQATETIGRWRCIWTDRKVVIITVKKLGIRLNIVHFISNAFKPSLTISFLVVEDKKWLVISIITENSGQTKGKTWLVKSVDRLFRPLDNESEVSPEKKRNRFLNSFTRKVPVTKTSERRFLL